MLICTFKVVFCWFLLLLRAAFALECHQCQGVESCNGSARDNVVQCDHGYAHSTLHHLTDMYPAIETEIEPSSEFICVFANFTLQNQLIEHYKTKGCLFKNHRTCSLKPMHYTGHLDCLSCESDRCNDAMSLVCNSLLVAGGCIAMWLFRRN